MVPVVFGRHSEDAGRRAASLNVVAITVLLVVLAPGVVASILTRNPFPLIVAAVIGIVLMQSPRIAQQWERAVVLRLGKFIGLRGPGLFWIVPFVDSVSSWIDQRTITTSFAAEQTLTSDTVPVNVDAVLFWMVHDAQKAALEVQDYQQAVSWAAQTGLRDIIGRTALTELLRGREQIENELQQLIDVRSNPWGITVQSVEMRDVVIPGALQDAMSRISTDDTVTPQGFERWSMSCCSSASICSRPRRRSASVVRPMMSRSAVCAAQLTAWA